MKGIVVTALLLTNVYLIAQKNASVCFEKWISLKNPGAPIISPDGKTIAYSVTTTERANEAGLNILN